MDSTKQLQRQKRWRIWFIVITVVGIIFYIAGGAMIGASTYDCVTYRGSSYYSYSYADYSKCRTTGVWAAGVAFVILACVLFLVWLVLLILRFTSWYRQPVSPAAQYSQPSIYTNQVPSAYPQSNPIAQPAATAHNGTTVASEKTTNAPTTNVQLAPATHFCSNCEHQTTGGYCQNCGSKVE